MKKILLLPALLLALCSLAQNSEFKTHKNGLIYNTETMIKLESIVDSLNLKYKSCELDRTFRATGQTVATRIQVDGSLSEAAKKDMDNQMPLEAFLKKYPEAEVEQEVLVIKSQYTNYRDEHLIEFQQVKLERGYHLEIDVIDQPAVYHEDMQGKWLYDYREESGYSDESIRAFYFPQNFQSRPLPDRYAYQIGYADCLIDTTTKKMLDTNEEDTYGLPEGWMEQPQEQNEDLLQRMRGTRVVGFCSMDSRPRTHAINIALLSAHTTNWAVFLRAHLDIMNDRFERTSDGSYAWAERKTYIKELEELDINVNDLIAGITLRMENPVTNHYYGSIGRLGRALSETTDQEAVEALILSMVKDPELDDYNRVLAYFLFDNYDYYRNPSKEGEHSINPRLAEAVQTLPAYLQPVE